MKRILSLTLCLFFVLAAGASVLAAEYEPTELFLEALEEDDFYLDEYDFEYELLGLNDNDDERVLVSFDMEDVPDMDVFVYFMDTETSCTMYLWDVIAFDESDFDDVVEICNTLNNNYRFARWYAMDDNTVNAQVDAIFRTGDGCGKTLVETLSMLIRVAEAGLSVSDGIRGISPMTEKRDGFARSSPRNNIPGPFYSPLTGVTMGLPSASTNTVIPLPQAALKAIR